VLTLAAEDAALLNDPIMEDDLRLMWAACTAHFATSTRNRRTRQQTRAVKHADAVTFEQLRMDAAEDRRRDRCDAAEVTP
jgi:hypothetical protein